MLSSERIIFCRFEIVGNWISFCQERKKWNSDWCENAVSNFFEFDRKCHGFCWTNPRWFIRNRIEYSNLASNQRGRNPFCICGKFHESLPWSIGCGKRKEGGRTIRNFVIRLIQFGNFKISSSEYLFGTLAELASQKCVEYMIWRNYWFIQKFQR